MHDWNTVRSRNEYQDTLDVLVLMDTHQIKPIFLLRARLKELNLTIPKCPKQTLVPDIAHAVQGKLGAAFLQEYRFYSDVVRFGSSSVVIQQSSYLEYIQSC